MLGLLYGLTPDQIDRLMGRGKYAYVPEETRSYGKPKPNNEPPISKVIGGGGVNLNMFR
jgi:hypothetical protein